MPQACRACTSCCGPVLTPVWCRCVRCPRQLALFGPLWGDMLVAEPALASLVRETVINADHALREHVRAAVACQLFGCLAEQLASLPDLLVSSGANSEAASPS